MVAFIAENQSFFGTGLMLQENLGTQFHICSILIFKINYPLARADKDQGKLGKGLTVVKDPGSLVKASSSKAILLYWEGKNYHCSIEEDLNFIAERTHS
jgi:hypothetical protein